MGRPRGCRGPSPSCSVSPMSPYGTFSPRAIRQHAQRLAHMFFDERNAKKVFDAYIPRYASLLPHSSIHPFPTCPNYPSPAGTSTTSPPPTPYAGDVAIVGLTAPQANPEKTWGHVTLFAGGGWAGVLLEVGSGVE
jgi:hypothetical protein